MKITQCLLILALLVVSLGADCGPAPPLVGFHIATYETRLASNGRPFSFLISGVDVDAYHVLDRPDLGVVQGSLTSLGYTSHGTDFYPQGRAAANWHFTLGNGPCGGQSITFPVRQRETQPIACDETGAYLRAPFYADPSAINLELPPAVVSVTGGGIDATFGMPAVDFYDDNGTLVAREYAYEVSSDGTLLKVHTPDLSSAESGSFVLIVSNVGADGNLSAIGTLGIGVFTFEPPPPPPDPCYCPPSEVCLPCENY